MAVGWKRAQVRSQFRQHRICHTAVHARHRIQTLNLGRETTRPFLDFGLQFREERLLLGSVLSTPAAAGNGVLGQVSCQRLLKFRNLAS